MPETVTFKLDKIVRDKVLQSMLELGQKPEYRELNGDELLKEQVRKVQEEAGELDVNDASLSGELAQLQSALNALRGTLGIDPETFAHMVAEVESDKGGFEKAYYVGKLTLKADDPWAQYYRSNADRFPEVKETS